MMHVVKTEIRKDSVILYTNSGEKLRLMACRDDIVRLSMTVSGRDFEPSVTGILPAEPAPAPFTAEETHSHVIFSAGRVRVTVRKKNMETRYDLDGKYLCGQPYTGFEIAPKEATIPQASPNYAGIGAESLPEPPKVHVPGSPAFPGTPGSMLREEPLRVPACCGRIAFNFEADERIYGLGQNDHGGIDRRRFPQYLIQHNFKAPVPCFVSDRGYGVFVDTGSYAEFVCGGYHGNIFYIDSAPMIDYYFISSGTLDGFVDGYRFLTGQAPMMPKWLFGYTQCKAEYKTQEEIVGVVREYRRRKVPLDQIVQDWQYWPRPVWSEKKFDPERYPDPQKMLDDIHGMNVHFMISSWPNSKRGENQKELWEKNQLLPDGAVYNAFDPAAGETFWGQLNRGLFRYGVDAWWCDCTEPYEAVQVGEQVTYDELKRREYELATKNMDSRKINLFALANSRNIYENQRKTTEEKRVVNLTRSGYAGQQRYSTVVWSGDIFATWQDLRRQVMEGVHYCVSGLPYWSVDIGGWYQTKRDGEGHGIFIWQYLDCEKEGDFGWYELYTRWLQFAAFVPMFRSHGTDTPREIWNFGDEGSVFYDTIKKFIELRYCLLPYIYSLAWQITSRSSTLMRMLAFDFMADKKACGVEDEFMFGPALLVCPVLEPMYYEGGGEPVENHPKTREVYLPACAGWYDWWTGAFLEGGQTVTADAPLEKIPLFVRAGSIVPMTGVKQYACERESDPYEIRIFEGADGSFTVYEDAGDGYAYEKGEYLEYDLHWNDAKRTLTISDRRGKGFSGMTEERILKLRTSSGSEQEVAYSGKALEIYL